VRGEVWAFRLTRDESFEMSYDRRPGLVSPAPTDTEVCFS